MKRYFFTALMLMIVVLVFTACGNENTPKDDIANTGGSDSEILQGKTENSQNGKNTDNPGLGSGRVHEPDNYNNNGTLNIMETDLGYYFNQGYYPDYSKKSDRNGTGSTDSWMNIKYFDKESGISIPLCNKPECEHLGDESCVATYKSLNVINSVLYEGYIYVYGVDKMEDLYRFNLYKVPLDGSSIDIVGTVFEDRQVKDERVYEKPNYVMENAYYFIIHKGYAYLPYYFRDGVGMMGFKGGGLKRMNIDTGEIEDVYSLELANDVFPCRLYAMGDEVYMYLVGNIKTEGWMSYDTVTKTVDYTGWDKAYAEKYGITLKKGIYHYNVTAENEKYGFSIVFIIKDEEKRKSIENGEMDISELNDDDIMCKISTYGKYSLNEIEDKSIIPDVKRSEIDTKGSYSQQIMVNDEQLFMLCNDRILVYSLKEDEWGKLLGVFEFGEEFVTEIGERKAKRETTIVYNYGDQYILTGGKLYYIQSFYEDLDPYIYYYSCPVDSILKGEGKWELLYLIKQGTY
ncbi:MAG: hypothetical protein IK007_06710 [Lachnospiraceae bacterium]|nr:hypothetical protein [Lachnospiraceae bacterium]